MVCPSSLNCLRFEIDRSLNGDLATGPYFLITPPFSDIDYRGSLGGHLPRVPKVSILHRPFVL